MAQDGVLYDGWGAEGLNSLNQSMQLMDQAAEVGINRYDLTRIVAAQAKEIAYAHLPQEDTLNPLGNSGKRLTPQNRVPHVMRSIAELNLEIDQAYGISDEELLQMELPDEEDAPPKPSPADARAGAALAATGVGLPSGAVPPPPLASTTSLDGDGGAANLQALNQELLQAADAEKAGRPASAGAGAPAADVAAAAASLSDEGFDQLLADLSEVGLDEDFDTESELGEEDEAALDALDSLFGSVVVDTSSSIEVTGMHPGD